MAIWIFCNVKCGSGKTTLAVNMAASLKGRILLIDADPQQSALKWADSAPENQPLPMTVMGYSGKQIHREIQKVADQYDYVLVDTPPSGLAATSAVRSALLVADLAVVPVAPSPLDIRETLAMAEQIREISETRGDDDPLQARLVVNRIRAGTLFGKEIEDALGEIGIPFCKTMVSEREAHKHAALEGVSVHQIHTPGGQKAAQDMLTLAKELIKCQGGT